MSRPVSSLPCKDAEGFSLIELLVVISIIAAILGILLPVVATSRIRAKQVICKNNLSQLLKANELYALNNDGFYVPASTDIYDGNLNCNRWYGCRDNNTQPFDTSKGPLADCLAGTMLQCPQKVRYDEIKPGESHYENGNGGYGYNLVYLGSTIWINGCSAKGCRSAAKQTDLKRPQDVLMFADTAMAKSIKGCDYLIKYPFADPPHHVINGIEENVWFTIPSIHFRHGKKAGVGWADGHVSDEKRAKYKKHNPDGIVSAEFNIGWIKPLDNSPYDLE
ncbi:MAG: type II secretion system GspH family protein [Anaerohalosphaeraceae bacterium]|nr:type II secretion system GspH family protein [Anaerohalosphaeraceae bacterium]